jgi:hypothetical protein
VFACFCVALSSVDTGLVTGRLPTQSALPYVEYGSEMWQKIFSRKTKAHCGLWRLRSSVSVSFDCYYVKLAVVLEGCATVQEYNLYFSIPFALLDLSIMFWTVLANI